MLWKAAYEGDYGLAHKFLQETESKDINDDLLKLFYMGYVCYKLGCDEDPRLVFKVVDQYLEEVLSPVRD